MSYTIAEVGIEDVQTIIDVTIQSFEDAFNKPFYMERKAAIHRWKAYMCKKHYSQKAKDPRIVYLATTHGEIVGFIAGHLTERFNLDGELQSTYILPEYQQ